MRRERRSVVRCLGNPEVLTNIIRKQIALTRGSDIPNIKPALATLAGGLAGVESAGYLKALYQFAPDAFDVCGANSAGAANTYAFLAGVPHLAPGVYEHLVTTDFLEVDVWHMRIRMKIDYVTKILREGFGGIVPDQQKVKNHRSKFIVFGTEYSTGEGFEIDAKTAQPDIVEGVCASMMPPGVCSGVVKIGDKEYVDGACGIPFPVRHIVKKYRPTDVLILFNRPLPEHMSRLEWWLFPAFTRVYLWVQGVPRPVRDRAAMIDRVMAEELYGLRYRRIGTWKKFFKKLRRGVWSWHDLFLRSEERQSNTIRYFIVAPEPHEAILSPWSASPSAIRQTGLRAYAGMHALLSKHYPIEEQ